MISTRVSLPRWIVPQFEAVLARCGVNQVRAADALGLNRNTSRKRLDKLGLRPVHPARSDPD